MLTIKREREIYEELYSIMAGSRASPGVHTTRGISIAMLAWQGLSLTAIYPLGSERCDKSRLGEWNRTRCYGHTSHKSEGRETRGGTGAIARAGNMSNMGHVCVKDGARGSWPSDLLSLQWGAGNLGVFCLSIIFCGFVKFVKFVVS